MARKRAKMSLFQVVGYGVLLLDNVSITRGLCAFDPAAIRR
ncbi:MAG: hypothetical protein P8Y45_12535 [Exilibacterium sp.]